MKGADILLEILLGEGVRHIFGNPGTTELPLIAALARGGGPDYVLGLQESVVVGMADGYVQASRRPTLVNLHAMAGLGNAVGNLTNAQVQGTPMVVTAGQADQRHLIADPLLSGDLTGLATPVTKWTHEVRQVADLGLVMRRAFRDTASAPTGPVFVSLPVDVLDDSVTGDAALRVPPSTVHRTSRAAPLEELVALLLETDPSRVAVLATDEVAMTGAVAELVALAETLGAPVYGSSLHANTVFPSSHPLWMGTVGMTAGDIHQTLRAYDRVLVLGGRPFMAYNYSPGPLVPPEVELLQITVDPHQLARSFPVRLGLVGHLVETLRDLRIALSDKGDPARAREMVAGIGAIAERTRAQADAEARSTYGQSPIAPVAAVHALLAALPENIPLVDESMTCDDYTRAYHRTTGPDRYFAARGGGLGWGMPAALGVSLALDREPVLCMVGDGSAMYSPQALWTAAHERLPVLFTVVNNTQYLMLKNNLRKRYADEGELPFIGMDVDQPAVDFLALAKSMGVPAARVERVSDIGAMAETAWRSGGPFLLELPIADG